MTEYTEFPGTPAPKPPPPKPQKPWFYHDPDKYDDKAAFVLAWVLSLATFVFLIAGTAMGIGRWVLAGLVCMILQWALVASQVPAGERYYEKNND